MITIRFHSNFSFRKLVSNLHQITQILLKKLANQFGNRFIIIIITETQAEIKFEEILCMLFDEHSHSVRQLMFVVPPMSAHTNTAFVLV